MTLIHRLRGRYGVTVRVPHKTFKGVCMEIIGYGILLAIGFYVAPLILTVALGAVALLVAGISSLFGGK